MKADAFLYTPGRANAPINRNVAWIILCLCNDQPDGHLTPGQTDYVLDLLDYPAAGRTILTFTDDDVIRYELELEWEGYNDEAHLRFKLQALALCGSPKNA